MKQYHRYRMDFDSKWLRWSASFVGAAIFLRVVYHLGLQYLTDAGGLFFSLWLPVALGLAYIVLLRGIRYNAPGVYAIWGCLICLSLLICVFSTGNVIRIILGILFYIACGGLLVLCTGGFLPGRLPASICFGVLLVGRILFFGLGRVTGTAWLPELSDLGFIAALICLPMGMVAVNKE